MNRRAALAQITLTAVLWALTPLATAEITSIAGFTQAEITEYRSGSPADTDRATESFPGTAPGLPLQVIARLISADPEEEGAGAVAAQFADPRDLLQPNPEEFAINLALSSISSEISYQARAVSRETRGVLFSARELDVPFGQIGPVRLTGRLFVDGALTILAAEPGQDLSDAFVLLRVTVVKSVPEQDDRVVFSGEVELRGTTDGDVTVVTEGSFPTGQLILTNLSTISDEFATLHTLIIPRIAINYPYSAIIGRPFTLQATVEVVAANVPGECGVAAVIGAPADTLSQVFGLTQGEAAAAKTLSMLNEERESPSGVPAFLDSPLPGLLAPGCGVLGIEAALGVATLVGLKRFGTPRTYLRK